jgi:hypothetical protein
MEAKKISFRIMVWNFCCHPRRESLSDMKISILQSIALLFRVSANNTRPAPTVLGQIEVPNAIKINTQPAPTTPRQIEVSVQPESNTA